MDNPLKGAKQRAKLTPHEICDLGNSHLAEIGRDDIEWIVRDGQWMIVWKKSAAVMLAESNARRVDPMDRRGQPMSESDTFKLNKELERLGAKVRYDRHGNRYDAETGEQVAKAAA
jgi:hypothetical protein